MTHPIADGIWPTMITPFTNADTVDEAALEALVAWYLARQVNGLFAVCQSSEMFYLSLEERVQLAAAVVRLARGRAPVIASGHISTDLSVKCLQTAQQTPVALSLDWSTCVPPTCNKWHLTLQARWLQERAIAAQRGWLLGNASRLLDSYNDDYTAGLLPLVWDLYACPDEALTRDPFIYKYKEATVKHPYLNIFGVTTTSLMALHWKKHHWIKSFLKCFVLVGGANVDTWRFWPGPQAYPADLVQGLQRGVTKLLPLPEASLNVVKTAIDTQTEPRQAKAAQLRAPLLASPIQLARGGEAWAAWERYARATGFDLLRRDRIDDIYTTSYGRLSTQLIKVAIIPAVLKRNKGRTQEQAADAIHHHAQSRDGGGVGYDLRRVDGR